MEMGIPFSVDNTKINGCKNNIGGKTIAKILQRN